MEERYTGRLVYPDQVREYEVRVARINPDQIVIEWDEAGPLGLLTATSTDGVFYNGGYSYKADQACGSADLHLFREDGGVILRGSWKQGWDEGSWEFQLEPCTA